MCVVSGRVCTIFGESRHSLCLRALCALLRFALCTDSFFRDTNSNKNSITKASIALNKHIAHFRP